jgi:hypothetical protein
VKVADTSTHYMELHHLHHGPPQDHQIALWWPNHQTRYPNWITAKHGWPRARTNPKIYLVIYRYKPPDMIWMMTLPDFQGTRPASKLACSLTPYSASNLLALPHFATRNEYSTQPHSWIAAQLVQMTHHNKSKMCSPLAWSSISSEIPNPP